MRVSMDAAATAQAIRRMLAERKPEIQDAARRTVNILAMRGVRAIQGEMRQVFDRPTAYALNSMKWVEDLPGPSAEVRWRGSEEFGEQAHQGYLKAQIYGGERRQKAMERRLQRSWPGAQDVFLVPTKYADLDAYGNVSRGQVVKILSAIQMFGGFGQGFDGNRRADRKSRGRRRSEDYFVIWPGSNRALPPGIYRQFGYGPGAYKRPVFFFARKAPVYRKRLDPRAVVERVVSQDMAAVWADRLQKVMRRGA